MKRVVMGFILGAVLATTSVATATSYWGTNKVACKKYGAMVACALRNGNGYAVGISHDYVLVSTPSGKTAYVHAQP